ncbi:GNAT family N-acetyltransferase [Flavobacterium sp.]|uniref:GNAT family N-acetyltransferase n=1 Tax=Flavobacterium sp. TaxID=239 RepID=UPI0028BD5E1A|nr:GNAT family N-acetyltransferase [Flavobacterium sp.]
MIRAYQEDDFDTLVAVLKLNVPDYFAPSEVDDFIEYLNHETEDYFVAIEAGKLIGSGGINYFYDDKTARISWDLIHPQYQGKGIGKKLLQHRLELLRNNPNIETVAVRTSQFAYPFYEKSGFVLVKTEKDFWAEGFDLYQMTLKVK